MNDYDLDEFKVYLLKTFKAFINFCEQHGLTYYAAFGTALGAIRHQGFHGMTMWMSICLVKTTIGC